MEYSTVFGYMYRMYIIWGDQIKLINISLTSHLEFLARYLKCIPSYFEVHNEYNHPAVQYILTLLLSETLYPLTNIFPSLLVYLKVRLLF